MKVIRDDNRQLFLDFCKKHLPSSLKVESTPYGYGYLNAVYRSYYKRSFIDKAFDSLGDAIAVLEDSRVTLYQPEYFSDFEDLATKYEAQGGKEVTIVYCES